MATWCRPISLELPKRPLGVQGLSLYETLTKSLLVSVSFYAVSAALLNYGHGPQAAYRRAVFFGLVTLALCLIWVRSYRFNEAFSRFSAGNVPPGPQWSDIRITSIGWNRGRFYAVNTFVHRLSTRIAPHGWGYNSVLYQWPAIENLIQVL